MAADSPRVDPQLRSQLRAASRGERVEAALTLRPGQGSADPAPPAEVERTVERVLRRVADETGVEAYEFNVFGFLESFAVAAEPQFVEKLLGQPEIESATANRRSDPETGSAT